MQTKTQLIEDATRENPSISLEALLDALERPTFENNIKPALMVKYATLFIAKRNAIRTGRTQIVLHGDEEIEVTPF